MKRPFIFTMMVLVVGLVACQNENNTNNNHTDTNSGETQDGEESEKPRVNVDSIVNAIDQLRSNIESDSSEPGVLTTSEMRAKIKQKWEKIHFYSVDGKALRIKTYPHTIVSNRTEEFYLQDGNLVLAVIEDDGSTGERGKTAEQMDKMYYYHSGEVIKEVRSNEEAEFGIMNSDGEELMQEVKEYLQLYSAKQSQD